MAVIDGLNAVGSGIGSGGTNSMSTIGQLTDADKAKAAQNAAVKTKVLSASIVDAIPSSLGVGEVVKFTNSRGKVEYYVGTYDGKISKPLTSTSDARDAVTTAYKKAEQVQATALRTQQKIEEAELKQELKAQGLPTKEISKIINAEKAANTAELTEFKSLLAEPNLQYGTRDPATNAFVASATPTPPPTSLLTYNDPVIAPTVQANIAAANESLAEFQLLKGITQPFLSSGNTTSGVNPYAIYQALDNGSIIATKDATGNTTGYTVSPEVAAAKGDQSGFMDATGMSKASARSLGLILNNDTILGGKANVVVDGKGNYFVNDASGADRYGTQKPLIDTGRVDGSGNKIFAEVSTDNSKRNLVSVVSNYVQQPDGTFKYAGIDSTDYTHIEGFNPIKALVIAGMSAGFGAGAGALSGLSGSAATAVGGAVGGGLGAALSGSNILKGALLGGLGGFGVGEIQAAARTAGGYTNLFNQVGVGDFSAFSGPANAGIKLGLDSAGNIIDATTGQSFTGAGIPNLNVNTVLPTTGVNVGLLGGTTAGDVLGSYMPNVENAANAVDLNPITNVPGGSPGINLSLNANGEIVDLATGLPFQPPGINLGLDAAGNIIDKATGLPFTGPGINVVNPITGTYVNPVTQIPFLTDTNTTGTGNTTTNNNTSTNNTTTTNNNTLTDILKDAATVATVATAVGPAITDLFTKTPAETVYTAPLLNNPLLPGNQVTDWNQYYNNLFKREGVGAGQFLGYDLMNRINVPQELMGLLGTSAQATPTTTTP